MRVCLLFALLLFTLSSWANPQGRRGSTLTDLRHRQAFILELLARVQMQAILNHQMALSIRHCHVNSRDTSEECALVRKTILTPFVQVVADARRALLLGFRDGLAEGNVFKIYDGVGGMWNLGTYKDVDWVNATPVETKAAQETISRWRSQARSEASRNANIGSNGPRHERFVKLKVREKRVDSLEEYKAILSQIVLLQPFSAATVTRSNVRAALDVIVQRGSEELQTLKRAARIAEVWMRDPESCAETVDGQSAHRSVSGGGGMAMPSALADCIQTPTQLSALLDYRSIVQGIVTDVPSFARVAQSMERVRTARSLLTGAMIAFPTLAVCFFAAPIVAVPVGGASGMVSFLQSQSDYNRVRRRELSRIVNEAGDVDWDALKSARLMRNVNVVLLPFFGAGRYIGPFARASAARTYLQGTLRLQNLILRRI